MAVSGMEDMNGELFVESLAGLGDEGGSLEANDGSGNHQEDCSICSEKLCNPRVLSCLHVYCEACIDKMMVNEAGDTMKIDETVFCPSCKQETKVSGGGAASLPTDYVLTNIVDVSAIDQSAACTCCKSKERAVARCSDCPHFLCANCKSAHELMRCFEKHHVIALEALRLSCGQGQGGGAARAIHGPVACPCHTGEAVKYYCRLCETVACGECLAREHEAGAGSHRCDRIADAEPAHRAELHRLAEAGRARAAHVGEAALRLDGALSDLQRQRDDARSAVADAFTAWRAALERCRERALRTLDRLHEERELRVMDFLEALDKTAQRTERACEFTARLLHHGNAAEIAALKKTVSSQLLRLLETTPDFDVRLSLEFVADCDKFEEMMQEHFCKFKTESSDDHLDVACMVGMSPGETCHGGGAAGSAATASSYDDFSLSPISPHPPMVSVTPTTSMVAASVGVSQGMQCVAGLNNISGPGVGSALTPINSIVEYNLQQLASIAEKESHPPPHSSPAPQFTLADLLTGDLTTSHAYNNIHALAKLGLNSEVNGCSSGNGGSGVVSSAPSQSTTPAPFIRATKATPMHIRFKFGQLGSGKGQFNSPHGFCLGNDEDIVVADTNNHRITVFEKSGSYKLHFGTAGKEEGQLWYPRKVAVMRATGKYVVCDRGNERSRMQIFTKNGHFLKKIAVRYIDIVAGLAVNTAGHIVAVDSVTPTVFVISESGDLLSWFDCSECMREPSDIAISGKEFFVCDFKGHCVVVFTEDGKFLRRIGCENVTNFPNGIDVSDAGDVLIGDSHGNKFHVAVFSREGVLVTEFECPYVKVSRCCGLKITSEGYIVTLAKNNHHVLVLNTLYIM